MRAKRTKLRVSAKNKERLPLFFPFFAHCRGTRSFACSMSSSQLRLEKKTCTTQAIATVRLKTTFPRTDDDDMYWRFSHDDTKFPTSKLLIPLRFYFHDV